MTMRQRLEEILRRICAAAPFVRASDAAAVYRLHKLAGDESASQVLLEAVDIAINIDEMPQLRSLGEIFQEEGRLHEFEAKLVGKLPPHLIEELVERTRRRFRGGRIASRYM